MRLLFALATNGITGGNRVLLELSRRLTAQGIVSDVWFWNGATGADWIDGINVVCKEILPEEDLSQYDVVLLSNAFLVPELLPCLGAATPILVCQSFESFCYGKTQEESVAAKPAIDDIIKLPIGRIAISHSVNKIIHERLGVSCEVVPAAVNLEQFDQFESTHPCSGEATQLHCKRVLFVGDYTWPLKGISDLLPALIKVHSEVPIELVIVTQQTKDRSRFDGLPFNTTVHQNPAQSQLADIYRSCDVYCCASWYEGFGLPPLEAGLCGVPTVSTRTGGITDYGIDGQNVLLANGNDSSDLAAKILELLLQPLHAERVSSACADTARSYSWSATIERFLLSIERLRASEQLRRSQLGHAEPLFGKTASEIEELKLALEIEGFHASLASHRNLKSLSRRFEQQCRVLTETGPSEELLAELKSLSADLAASMQNQKSPLYGELKARYDLCRIILSTWKEPDLVRSILSHSPLSQSALKSVSAIAVTLFVLLFQITASYAGTTCGSSDPAVRVNGRTACLDTTIYVSPKGDDTSIGETNVQGGGTGPLASIEGAQMLLRKRRRNGTLSGAPRVVIGSGTYRLHKPICFSPEDSGSPTAPVQYVAAPGAVPVFTGGESVRWTSVSDRLWKAQIPGAAEHPFEQLWVNGARCVRARMPNKGYFYLSKATATTEDNCVPPWLDWLYSRVWSRVNAEQQLALYELRQTFTRSMDEGKRSFKATDDDMRIICAISPAELPNTLAVIYHSWETSRLPIRAVLSNTNRIELGESAQWDFCKWAPAQRYRIENCEKALDEPGEWFLDRSGCLRYIPRRVDQTQTTQAVIPRLDSFIHLTGTASNKVHDIEFRGLSFQYADYKTPKSGNSDPVCEISVPAAITIDFARSIAFSHCNVSHIGTYAIWFRENCQSCEVEHCSLEDLGAGGIRIGLTEIVPPDSRTKNITVRDSTIEHTGRIHAGANAVWIGESSDNQITHNQIAYTTYSGISVGWRWGYANSTAHRNLISYNYIHDIGDGQLNDLAGVYIVGRCEGSTVSNNLINAIFSNDEYSRGAWAIYNDEGCSNVTVSRNLCFNTTSGGYCLNFGKDNVVTNNIFAFGKTSQIERTKADSNQPFTFERNIIYWNKGDPLFKTWLDAAPRMNSNIYWCIEERNFKMAGMSFRNWQDSGKDRSSVVANPRFCDPEHGDFRLLPNSPALKLGFENLALSTVGPRGGKRVRDLRLKRAGSDKAARHRANLP